MNRPLTVAEVKAMFAAMDESRTLREEKPTCQAALPNSLLKCLRKPYHTRRHTAVYTTRTAEEVTKVTVKWFSKRLEDL